MANDQYGVSVPQVRPDAAPEDPQARPTNVFKKALNTFMYGTTDPSYVDKGESRARGVFQHYAGEGMALSAIARPEVAGAIYQSYAQQGAQAAQNMRERYYQKEHRQMIQAQIIPLKQEFDSVDESYRSATQIVYMPVPVTRTPEQLFERNRAMQDATPAPPEVIKTGKTAEGKDKTQVVEGVADQQPNAAIGQQTLGAVEYTPESLAYIDPVTGSPVQIMSQRGRAIEREASDQLMMAHNKLMIGMMDTFAQYPGNPFAVQSMQKIMDGMTNASGKAVTGRADQYEQLKFYQGMQESQAKIAESYANVGHTQAQTAGAVVQSNTLLRNLDKSIAGDLASTSGAVERAQQDPEFLKTLPKRAQGYIKQGTPVEEWDEKTALEAATRMDRKTELELKGLEADRKAGLIHIDPRQYKTPENWANTLRESETFKRELPIRYAEMASEYTNKIRSLAGKPADEQEQIMREMGVPIADTELRNLLKQGITDQDKVKEFLLSRIQGTKEYDDARTKTDMDALVVALRDQPELNKSMLENNEGYIQRFIQQQRRFNAPEEQIQSDVETMRTDPIGTHILVTTGQPAPDDYRPHGYEPSGTTGTPAPAGEGRRPLSDITGQESSVGVLDPNKAPATSNAPTTEPMTLDRAWKGNAAGMTNDELGEALSTLAAQRANLMVMTDATMNPRVAKAVGLIDARLNELNKHHISPVGQVVSKFLQWREDKQAERGREVEDLLTSISTSNEPEQSSSSKTEQSSTSPSYAPVEFGGGPVSVTPKQAMTFDPSTMSQPQLTKAMDLLKGKQAELMEAGDYSPKSVEVLRQLAARLDELSAYHINWAESLFRTDEIPRVN
jgi:hypothetical protein